MKSFKEFRAWWRHISPRTTNEEFDTYQAYLKGLADGRDDYHPEGKKIQEVIEAARKVQEFLWSDMNLNAGLEEFRRMIRKRVAKIDQVNIDNPHWRVELTKRCLQTAAICVNLMTKLDRNLINTEENAPGLVSNLPEYGHAEPDIICEECKHVFKKYVDNTDCPACGKQILPF